MAAKIRTTQMNATAKAAIALACATPEQFKAEVAEVSTPDQQAIVAPDQGPVGYRPPSGSKDVQPAAARAEGLKAGRAERLTEGHAGVKPAEMSAYQQGAAAARALLDIAIAAPAEMAKYQAGAAAARDVLNKVAGAPDEMDKYAAGAVAARLLLGKKPERPLAHT
jgi:hypothetical protein